MTLTKNGVGHIWPVICLMMLLCSSLTAQNQQQLIQQAKAAGIPEAQIEQKIKEVEGAKAQETVPSDFEVSDREDTSDQVTKRSAPINLSGTVYGREIFSAKNLSFAPNLNIATPKGYRLAAGDEIVLNIWGASQSNETLKISPEGAVLISGLGPVYIVGMSIEQAQEHLKNELSRIYQDLICETPSTYMSVSLGGIRSIKVNMVGEVAVPGTYTLPSLATLFNALYMAGGVNDIGSLRNIKVYRNSKPIATLDVYDYLLNGKYDSNVRLEDNDMIVVEPYDKLVQIAGKVKRGRIFEMKNNEDLDDLIRFAGDFMGDAYTDNVTVKRKNGRMHSIYNVDRDDLSGFVMQDGDAVQVGAILNAFENRITINGSVFRPGEYALTGSVNTVKALIDKAEGISSDAFTQRATITRLLPDASSEIISFDLGKLLRGQIADIALQNDDVVTITSIFDTREAYTVTIQGAVNNPQTFPYRENMSLEDIVLMAGGTREAASEINIEVSRRIKNPKAELETNRLSETFNLTLNNGLKQADGRPFILEPFDVVNIRFSPAYHTQKSVTILGEALFNGSYVMAKKNERLSDLIIKAGGLSKDAYVKGASLKRKMNDDEKARVETLLRLSDNALSKSDSISVESLNLDNYMVGIDLAAAMKKPGGEADITLREGDILTIPQYQGTVKISGAVVYPNTVSYKKGMDVGDYLDQAGGYTDMARKRPIVIYANGTVGTTKKRLFWKLYPKIEPGAEVLVPAKSAVSGNKMGLAEIMSLTSSTTSIAAMVTSIINNMK